MADQKLIGQNYTPLDLVAKVTGRAKYAEDYRAEGMLFCKLLLSPMPHARVRGIDASAALAMPGVKGMLTADDLPPVPAAFASAERPLTMEPFYQGEPILALAAVDELTAVEAIERITVDYEPLPFVVDPVESLRPNGSNARLQGNVWYPAPLPQGAAPQGPRPPRRFERSSGARRPSPRNAKAGCRWARRPRNGPSAISTPVSPTLRSSSTKPSWCPRPAIRRWRVAAP